MKSKNIWLPIMIILSLIETVNAQDYITKVKIEFEKKVNQYRPLEGGNFDEYKSKIPKYNISYYSFTYANGQSLYQFDHDNSQGATGGFSMPNAANSIFIDYKTKQTVVKKSIIGQDYIIKDSLSNVKWRITKETRTIAGYECRKAIGIIYDTVYGVAFYCEQFVMPAGPEAVQGLPGMILGLAIPRYNTTWFATKVELANFNETEIVPSAKGKKISKKELVDEYMQRLKGYGVKDLKFEAIERQLFNRYVL
jgi:GLPGLI family protein